MVGTGEKIRGDCVSAISGSVLTRLYCNTYDSGLKEAMNFKIAKRHMTKDDLAKSRGPEKKRFLLSKAGFGGSLVGRLWEA